MVFCHAVTTSSMLELLIFIYPLFGFSNPDIIFNKVLFPEPLGPRIPIHSPLLSVALIFLNNFLSAKLKLTSLISNFSKFNFQIRNK
jgi:hypothetical protein